MTGRLLRSPGGLLGAVLLALLAAMALLAQPVTGWLGLDPQAVDLFARYGPPGPGHPLGTDEVGRDLLARLLLGGQVSLAVAMATALLAALLGTAIGLAAGVLGGRADAWLMRLTDGVIALPLLPLLLVLAALDPAKLGLPADLFQDQWAGAARLVVIIALVGWTTSARLVRASALTVRRQDFVRAAQALGAGPVRVMLRHVLPNSLGPLIVATTLSMGNILLLESALSFLGLGVPAPLPSWGNMLSTALEAVWEAPAQAVWPGLMIFLAVLAFNLLGDALRDALDPRSGLSGK